MTSVLICAVLFLGIFLWAGFSWTGFRLRTLHVQWTDLLPHMNDNEGINGYLCQAYQAQLDLLKTRTKRFLTERDGNDPAAALFFEKAIRIIDASTNFPKYDIVEETLVFFSTTEVAERGCLGESVMIEAVPTELMKDFWALRWTFLFGVNDE